MALTYSIHANGNGWYWARVDKPIRTKDGIRYHGTMLYQTKREAERVLLAYLIKTNQHAMHR
jgi:hypothetical protein